MKEIVILLRAMSIFTHMAHHGVGRAVFLQDHEMLGDFYEAQLEAFDEAMEGLIERMLASGMALSPTLLFEISAAAASKVNSLASLPYVENGDWMRAVLALEEELCGLIDAEFAQGGITEGGRQLLGDIAKASQKPRQYFLRNRLRS